MTDASTHRGRHAPATARNRDAILAVLERVLPNSGLVLEIASGTGEHAVHFAAHLPTLRWQPSDPDPAAIESISAWSADAAGDNLHRPLVIDAAAETWPLSSADAVVCSNMVHIAPWSAAEGLFAGAARILSAGSVLFLYGPFSVGGVHTAPSNEAFDRSLRRQNPAWGVRDLNDIAALGQRHRFVLAEIVDMPANNKSVVLRRV
ncbi:MAG: DUF938 domain-containing protein [Alphaproteobacteria bacterium]|nr:DUF938 domain-containing protein [Alphaproteobacteria bacterium]